MTFNCSLLTVPCLLFPLWSFIPTFPRIFYVVRSARKLDRLLVQTSLMPRILAQDCWMVFSPSSVDLSYVLRSSLAGFSGSCLFIHSSSTNPWWLIAQWRFSFFPITSIPTDDYFPTLTSLKSWRFYSLHWRLCSLLWRLYPYVDEFVPYVVDVPYVTEVCSLHRWRVCSLRS